MDFPKLLNGFLASIVSFDHRHLDLSPLENLGTVKDVQPYFLEDVPT